MSKLKVEYKSKSYEPDSGQSIFDFLKGINEDFSNILAVKLNGKMVDLSAELKEPAKIEPVSFDMPEGKEIYWHSTSHIMATAVKRLYPDVKVTIGPAIEEGFYYDFDRDKAFSDDDLVKIEEEMENIAKENKNFIRKEISKQEAIAMFTDMKENYKVEIINDIKDDKVSLYTVDTFIDLCRGPHVRSSGKIKSIKLLKVAGAYWRGNEKNKMLQRIYGISFPDKEMLKEYLFKIEEAKSRDHRKLGKELDLFSTHEEFGPGLIYWHPKGAIVRKEIEDFWRNEHLKRDYGILYTPHVAKIDLWHISGHTGFYRENMYPTMQMDEVEYQIKPMNCPFHIQIYKNSKKSYRDLPLRWCELGTVYRYEKSGVLHGLMRVRGFTQDDAHLFIREDQLEDELVGLIDFVTYVLKTFGFDKYEVYLSTRPENSVGELKMWEKAENALKSALEKTKLTYQIDPGEGVFYGPKIDIKIKDALNRTWQCSTIQVDFNLPERFDLVYTGSDGKEHRTVMIHRALLGSFERFFGVLIEHYKGAFPVWLSPKQVSILTINEKVEQYANNILKKLKEQGIRVEMSNENEKIGAKIRNATLQKIPYMLIIGEKEAEAGNMSVRKRTGEEEKGVKLDIFMNMLLEKIKNKDINI